MAAVDETTSNEREAMVRIVFPLEPDADGYPPVGSERLWARRIEGHRYQIDNISFFVLGTASGDVVEASEGGGLLMFDHLVEQSGHSTLQILVRDPSDVPDVRRTLQQLGCESEQSHIPGLIAADVPDRFDYRPVRETLSQGAAAGRWEFQEACLSDVHRSHVAGGG